MNWKILLHYGFIFILWFFIPVFTTILSLWKTTKERKWSVFLVDLIILGFFFVVWFEMGFNIGSVWSDPWTGDFTWACLFAAIGLGLSMLLIWRKKFPATAGKGSLKNRRKGPVLVRPF